MGKKNSKIQQEATPTLAQYLAQRAQQVRDSAAFELSHQDSPDIPVLPRVSDECCRRNIKENREIKWQGCYSYHE